MNGQPKARTMSIIALIIGLTGILGFIRGADPEPNRGSVGFNISFPASLHSPPITGRAFLIVNREGAPEPRTLVGMWGDKPPMFGVDVNQLAPGDQVTVDATTLGYPVSSLSDLPDGEYYVQALMNVYTQFHRSDGHTIWAHMDQWEGQQFNISPGNLYSKVQRVRLDRSQGTSVNIQLTETIPPVRIPPDNQWIKRIRIQSKLLSKFWGQPVYLGAVVLLPKDYGKHPDLYYPTIYEQGHFGLEPPLRFDDNGQSGNLHESWNSGGFPRMIAVTFQHPTPYFDDSYAVNSANNGPYGDALLTELIPYLEEHFRMIPKPYARILTGGSTGGWESLALQLYHPDFFGGTWTLYPDPIDFTRYQLIDIYNDSNAFLAPGYQWKRILRPMKRSVEGQVEVTIQEMSQLEEVLGSHGRSGQQFEAWEATYGPVGEDGYPKPLWDKRTGEIDRKVAEYMQDKGFDLAYYLKKNWAAIGAKLQGKIHIAVGDMDNYYLNLAVYRFEEFMRITANPHYEGTFEYGRPMQGHGWQPWTNAQLVRIMADHIAQNAPKNEDTAGWK